MLNCTLHQLWENPSKYVGYTASEILILQSRMRKHWTGWIKRLLYVILSLVFGERHSAGGIRRGTFGGGTFGGGTFGGGHSAGGHSAVDGQRKIFDSRHSAENLRWKIFGGKCSAEDILQNISGGRYSAKVVRRKILGWPRILFNTQCISNTDRFFRGMRR